MTTVKIPVVTVSIAACMLGVSTAHAQQTGSDPPRQPAREARTGGRRARHAATILKEASVFRSAESVEARAGVGRGGGRTGPVARDRDPQGPACERSGDGYAIARARSRHVPHFESDHGFFVFAHGRIYAE